MVVVVLCCLAPYLVHGVYGQGQLIDIADYAILTLGFYWSFVLAGEFTFAVFGFFAIGSYLSVWVALRTDFLVGLITATLACTALGALLKFALRRAGVIYFAMGTIAFGSLVTIVFQNWTGFTGGFAGEGNIPLPGLFGYDLRSLASQYYLLIAVMAIVLIATVLMERSPANRDLIFARDLGPVASTAGLRPDRLKIIAFAVGCGIQGAAGSLFAHTSTYLSLDSFTTQISLNVLLMILLGGIGSIYGPLLGALVIVELPEVLRSIQSYADLVYAILVLVVIVVFPLGITGLRGQPPGRFVSRQLRHLGSRRSGSGLDDA
jgi:branched-chain amino acid transport system permease protein